MLMSVTAKIENKIKKITLYIITSEKRTLINGKEQIEMLLFNDLINSFPDSLHLAQYFSAIDFNLTSMVSKLALLLIALKKIVFKNCHTLFG